MQRFERWVVGGSPAARSIFSAWPSSSGLRLLSGSTQVQILPRRPVFPESKTAKRGDRLEAGSGRQACGQDHYSPPFSSCSSKAEPSVDNRSTAERYRARGPFFILCKHRQRCSGFVNRRGRRTPGAEIHFFSQRRTHTDVGGAVRSVSCFRFQTHSPHEHRRSRQAHCPFA